MAECIIITIGDELLSGLVINTNASWLGSQLNEIGIDVLRMLSIRDDHHDIIEAIKGSFADTNLLILTGGLGPTKDDVTKKAIAKYFDSDMAFSEITYQRLEKLLSKFNRTPTESHKHQCFLPVKAELMQNGMGTAPGMWLEENDKVLISLPGVPVEMKHLFEKYLKSRLKEKFVSQHIIHRTILTVGEGESRIAGAIEDIETELPDGLKISFLPSFSQVRIRITGKGENEVVIKSQVDITAERIITRLGKLVYGEGRSNLSEVVGKLLLESGKTVSTAESCTGGNIAHKITSIPGSSTYFKGSVIAYANDVKISHLGVLPVTLENHGAVSEQTIIEMAEGVKRTVGTDFGIATSGVAGPGGGTSDKPVGTVWIACAGPERTKTIKLQLTKNRLGNIEYSSIASLNLLRNEILEAGDQTD